MRSLGDWRAMRFDQERSLADVIWWTRLLFCIIYCIDHLERIHGQDCRMYIYISYLHVNVNVFVCVYVNVFVWAYVYVYIYIHIYTYVCVYLSDTHHFRMPSQLWLLHYYYNLCRHENLWDNDGMLNIQMCHARLTIKGRPGPSVPLI